MAQSALSPEEAREILGVSEGATENEVKKALRKQLKQYHPSKIMSRWRDAHPDMDHAAIEASESYQQEVAEANELTRLIVLAAQRLEGKKPLLDSPSQSSETFADILSALLDKETGIFGRQWQRSQYGVLLDNYEFLAKKLFPKAHLDTENNSILEPEQIEQVYNTIYMTHGRPGLVGLALCHGHQERYLPPIALDAYKEFFMEKFARLQQNAAIRENGGWARKKDERFVLPPARYTLKPVWVNLSSVPAEPTREMARASWTEEPLSRREFFKTLECGPATPAAELKRRYKDALSKHSPQKVLGRWMKDHPGETEEVVRGLPTYHAARREKELFCTRLTLAYEAYASVEKGARAAG